MDEPLDRSKTVEALHIWKVTCHSPHVGMCAIPCQTPNHNLSEVEDALRNSSAYDNAVIIKVEHLGQLGKNPTGFWVPVIPE